MPRCFHRARGQAAWTWYTPLMCLLHPTPECCSQHAFFLREAWFWLCHPQNLKLSLVSIYAGLLNELLNFRATLELHLEVALTRSKIFSLLIVSNVQAIRLDINILLHMHSRHKMIPVSLADPSIRVNEWLDEYGDLNLTLPLCYLPLWFFI